MSVRQDKAVLHRAAVAAFVLVLGMAIPLARTRAAAPAPTLRVLRQIDNGGPLAASETAMSTDHSVWVQLALGAPVAAPMSYRVVWRDQTGKAIVSADAKAEAGATEALSGIYIAGRPIAQAPGSYRVTVTQAGQADTVAEVAFELKASASDPNRPAVVAKLGQGADASAKIEGETARFSADNRAVWLAVESKDAIPEGHRIVPKVFGADGKLVVIGKPVEYQKGSNRLANGFLIAGKDWAKAGGNYRFRLTWDDDPEPLAELPFSISAANRYALLVGIKDYPPAGPENDLPGCDKDVESMRNMLMNAYGVPAEHIAELRDLDATKAGIEKALSDLAARAGPDDAVLFYYSGHGAQAPDLDGDEDDGWDEAIVPAEVMPSLVTTEAEINRLITDDRMAELLRAFKTRNVTVVFDSCHSGTAVRDAEDVEPPDELASAKFRHIDYSRALLRKAQEARRQRSSAPPLSLPFAGVERVVAGSAQTPSSVASSFESVSPSYVFISGCRPWETSGCTSEGGFLTRSLVEAVRTSSGRSWDQLMPAIREGVAEYRPGQNPTIDGAAQRLPFSTEASPIMSPYARPFVAVVGAAKAEAAKGEKAAALTEGAAGTHRALLEGNQSLYIEQSGALYDAYPEGDPDFAGKPTARVRITGERERVVVAAPAGRPPVEQSYSTADIISGTIHRGDRLVPAALAVPNATVRVGVMVSAKSPQSEQEKLVETARALLAEFKKIPGFETVLEFKFADVDYVIEPRMLDKQVSAFVWSSGGWRIANFAGGDADVVAKTAAFLKQRHAQTTRLTRLSNPSPQFRFVADPEGGDRIYSGGDSVGIRVLAGADCYLTVVPAAVGQVGNPIVLEQRLKAGEPSTLKLTIPPGASGQVPVKIIATRDPLDKSALQTLTAADPVTGLVKALQQRYGNGGAGARFISSEGWADATLRLTVGKQMAPRATSSRQGPLTPARGRWQAAFRMPVPQ